MSFSDQVHSVAAKHCSPRIVATRAVRRVDEHGSKGKTVDEHGSKGKTVASADATAREGLAVELAFAAHLIWRIGHGSSVELFPTRLTIGRPALLNIYGSAIENCLAF